MKKTITALFLLSIFCSLASAEGAIDFDGRNANHASINSADINGLVGEFSNVPSVKPPYKFPANTLVIKMEVKSEDGEWHVVKPVKNDGRANFYKFFPNEDIKTTLSCTSNNPNQYPNYWAVSTTYRDFPSHGGHEHSNPPPPALKDPANQDLPNPLYSGTHQINQNYVYDWITPEYATRITQESQFSYACTGSATSVSDIMVPGLVDMPKGKNYTLYDDAADVNLHQKTHYGTQTLIDTLTNIANSYRKIFPSAPPIAINDMSLPWGGLFDVNHDWKKPHSLHRCGNQADIRDTTDTLPPANREKFLELACKAVYDTAKGDTTILREVAQPHLHISVKQSEINDPQLYYCRPLGLNYEDYMNPPTPKWYVCCDQQGHVNQDSLANCIK